MPQSKSKITIRLCDESFSGKEKFVAMLVDTEKNSIVRAFTYEEFIEHYEHLLMKYNIDPLHITG